MDLFSSGESMSVLCPIIWRGWLYAVTRFNVGFSLAKAEFAPHARRSVRMLALLYLPPQGPSHPQPGLCQDYRRQSGGASPTTRPFSVLIVSPLRSYSSLGEPSEKGNTASSLQPTGNFHLFIFPVIQLPSSESPVLLEEIAAEVTRPS